MKYLQLLGALICAAVFLALYGAESFAIWFSVKVSGATNDWAQTKAYVAKAWDEFKADKQ